jgi:pilus assembly protein Flp/PilA
MRRGWRIIRNLLRSEDGPTAVEYAILLTMIALICLFAIKTIGSGATSTPSATASSLSGN